MGCEYKDLATIVYAVIYLVFSVFGNRQDIHDLFRPCKMCSKQHELLHPMHTSPRDKARTTTPRAYWRTDAIHST